jgi:hypothetical protein
MAEQAVLDPVPLRGARRIVMDVDHKARRIGELFLAFQVGRCCVGDDLRRIEPPLLPSHTACEHPGQDARQFLQHLVAKLFVALAGRDGELEKHADFLLALIELESDLTLDEVVGAMRKLKISGSRTAVWRFFQRHKITFKKKPARNGAGARGRSASTPTPDARTGPV